LRALLVRKKAEQFATPVTVLEKNDRLALEKMKEKNRILERLKQNDICEFSDNL
jgi:hypothetical protein